MINRYLDNQLNIKNMLLSAYHNNRLSHAYIFSGEKGVGKREMALFFASMLYCKNNICLKCDTCNQILNSKHINLYEIFPDGNMIKKQQIIDLQEEFSKTSLKEGPRIYIINDADKMNESSANSLLKFIEEPTNQDIYAILLTSNVSNILPTIRSRCQILNFRHIKKDLLVDLLVNENIKIEDAQILKEFTNNVEEAKELLNDTLFNELKILIEEFLKIKDSKDSIIYINRYLNKLSNNQFVIKYLELLSFIYEDMLFNENMKLSSLKDLINDFMKNKTKDTIKRNLEDILNSKKMVEANVQPKNVIVNLFINLF